MIGGGTGGFKRKSKVASDIPDSSLADMAFLLLIFFMVSTTFPKERPIKLDFSKVPREQFEAKRLEYHRQLQEAFFARYRIKGNEVHVIRRGESVWVLAQQRYNIPIWLLRQYNPDIDLGAVRPGTKLVIPLLEPVVAEPAA